LPKDHLTNGSILVDEFLPVDEFCPHMVSCTIWCAVLQEGTSPRSLMGESRLKLGVPGLCCEDGRPTRASVHPRFVFLPGRSIFISSPVACSFCPASLWNSLTDTRSPAMISLQKRNALPIVEKPYRSARASFKRLVDLLKGDIHRVLQCQCGVLESNMEEIL
jgi:hypothetical protein